MRSLKLSFTLIKFLILAWILVVQTSCAISPHQISLEKIESRPYSGAVKDELEFMVISDRDRFHEIYDKIRSLELPRPSPPAVDFKTHHILIAFMGRRSTAGYTIDFRPAGVLRNNEMEVKVVLNSPRRGAVLAQVTTNPYAIAKIAKGGYESVKFVDDGREVLDVVKVSRDI